MKPAISVENLSKQYRIGKRRARGMHNLTESIAEGAKGLWHRLTGQANGNGEDTFWALKDVSFDVQAGDIVGIVGRNGAGKSTLLKILSRITEPTSGRATLRGRMGSLLEVGTGFHPELTGRENIYLNGSILGMSKSEIGRNFDEIVAFSEIEEFLDTPVKRYSSGMQVRLGFGVAAHLDPETLVVDEVLAVGDAAFQKKCLGKLNEVARGGRTVLFVSHNMAAVQNLCSRVVVLSRGETTYEGPTSDGIRKYMLEENPCGDAEVDLGGHPSRRPGCSSIIKRIRFLDGNGALTSRFQTGARMKIELTVDPGGGMNDPQFGIGVEDWLGTRVFSMTTNLSASNLPALTEPCKVLCVIEEIPLVPGRYFLSLSAGSSHNWLKDALDNVVSFEVEHGDFFGNGHMPGPELGRVLVRSAWKHMFA